MKDDLTLTPYQEKFINFMVKSEALRFGDFTLNSGRKSPYFMNAGAYVTGFQLRQLGEFYAHAIAANFGFDFDVLFGPAYKGIPLAVATTAAISEHYGQEIRYCANRKEAKEHGETGHFLGSLIRDGDRVVIIEDVTSTGKSVGEIMPLLKQYDTDVIGLIVSLNRMERASGELSAMEEIHQQYGFKAKAIVTIAEVMEYLHNRPIDGHIYIDDTQKQIYLDYIKRYGAKV
ncbi:MAG: orotate phosphoribosyltransferase [Lachnospiraceae bacterium]|jgi:orotate phosphoribosyltransferase|nr:orotate phosphoribosyltransferase [Lachnospiraceae bacterium]